MNDAKLERAKEIKTRISVLENWVSNCDKELKSKNMRVRACDPYVVLFRGEQAKMIINMAKASFMAEIAELEAEFEVL